MTWNIRSNYSTASSFYMPFEASLFSIRMHHSGSFRGSTNITYVPNVINYFDNCNCHEIMLKDLHEMAIQLGHYGWVRFYNCLSGNDDCSNLKLIVTDEDAQSLLRYINAERVVDVYVDTVEAHVDEDVHGGNEDNTPIVEVVENFSDSVSNDDDTDGTDSTFTDGFEDGDYDSDDMHYDENVDDSIEWVGAKEPTKIIGQSNTLVTSNPRKIKSTYNNIYQGDAGIANFEFQVGLCFNTCQDFRDAVRTYSSMQGRPTRYKKMIRTEFKLFVNVVGLCMLHSSRRMIIPFK